MEDGGRSPKRVRILASINPLLETLPEQAGVSRSPPPEKRRRRSRSPRIAQDPHETESRTTRFRFKDKYSSSKSRKRHTQDSVLDQLNHDRRRRRRRRRAASPPPPETAQGDGQDAFEEAPLDEDAAFRASLFDAMADDEGAAYWEGVYGQPIHVYEPAREQVNERGELERMTDEQYAEYVRHKMWEKTHAGLVEERERRARAREAKARKDEEDKRIQAEIDRSLRQGEERRKKRGWKDKWTTYAERWRTWDGQLDSTPWPVESGDRRDLGEGEVRSFYVRAMDLEGLGETAFLTKLKEERVRWHPDKIQQKMGSNADTSVMKDATAIFQIIDRLWSDTRRKAA